MAALLLSAKVVPAILREPSGENQLPDGSMSLSPLDQPQRSDLHVNTREGFHDPLGSLLPMPAQITIFRVLTHLL